ncbi:AMP-binding protein [Variovorax soli]|uniref:Acyl-CoA synthetase (AMP-forming)/AMP-acid ligase II n=1 Tax=Variovorax soli TaxID=376815 RepID=A0ABU1NH27_9BURK|nr:AMP-binding protein [Variovorax soli]MDR6537181.1 acyl-CoA synthetase (AMP-forming)/AMP-acid ligase II [Variovorax soli]
MTSFSSGPAAAPTRIHQLLDSWVHTQPHALALQDPGLALSYLALKEASESAARQLADLQVRAGDRVLVVGENCAAIGVLVLALSRLDAWSIVVNARLSEREIDTFIAHSGARRVIYTCHVSADAQKHAQRHGALAQSWGEIGTLWVGALAREVQPEPCSPEARDQVASMIYTSGTSGAPKGVMLTHANLMFAAASARDIRGLGPGDLIYGVLPMAHVVGLSTQFLGCIASGAALQLEPRFSPAALAQALAQQGVTAFVGVPAMFAKLLDWAREQGQALQAPALRFACVVGSPLTPSLKAAVEVALGQPLHNGYGLTETAPTVAQTRIEAPRRDCTVGFPLPGVQTRIVDAGAGAEPAAGGVGELWVRGPNLMKGYYRNEALTREVVNEEGWFNTGDMARRDADGALHIVGRSKELIIRSGFNVYPVEVEQALNSHPAVVQSAVVGRTVEHNEEVVAFVELVSDAQPGEEAMREYLRERLSPYKVPSEIRFLAQLPAAPTGKILKSELKTLALQGRTPL